MFFGEGVCGLYQIAKGRMAGSRLRTSFSKRRTAWGWVRHLIKS